MTKCKYLENNMNKLPIFLSLTIMTGSAFAWNVAITNNTNGAIWVKDFSAGYAALKVFIAYGKEVKPGQTETLDVGIMCSGLIEVMSLSGTLAGLFVRILNPAKTQALNECTNIMVTAREAKESQTNTFGNQVESYRLAVDVEATVGGNQPVYKTSSVISSQARNKVMLPCQKVTNISEAEFVK